LVDGELSHHLPAAYETDLGRVVLVCIVAGIVVNILAYLADATVLAAQGAARDEDARHGLARDYLHHV
jgi:hypothetical protein